MQTYLRTYWRGLDPTPVYVLDVVNLVYVLDNLNMILVNHHLQYNTLFILSLSFFQFNNHNTTLSDHQHHKKKKKKRKKKATHGGKPKPRPTVNPNPHPWQQTQTHTSKPTPSPPTTTPTSMTPPSSITTPPPKCFNLTALACHHTHYTIRKPKHILASPQPLMNAKELMKLFDNCWFEDQIFTKQPNLTKPSSFEANPENEIQEKPSEPEISCIKTRKTTHLMNHHTEPKPTTTPIHVTAVNQRERK